MIGWSPSISSGPLLLIKEIAGTKEKLDMSIRCQTKQLSGSVRDPFSRGLGWRLPFLWILASFGTHHNRFWYISQLRKFENFRPTVGRKSSTNVLQRIAEIEREEMAASASIQVSRCFRRIFLCGFVFFWPVYVGGFWDLDLRVRDSHAGPEPRRRRTIKWRRRRFKERRRRRGNDQGHGDRTGAACQNRPRRFVVVINFAFSPPLSFD